MMKRTLLLSAAVLLALSAPTWSQVSGQRERTQGTNKTTGTETQRGRTEGRELENSISSELSGAALVVEAMTRLENTPASVVQGRAADWLRSCRIFSSAQPKQPWMNPNHVPGTILAKHSQSDTYTQSRMALDRARQSEPPILWGFGAQIAHVPFEYLPEVMNVDLDKRPVAELKSMVHCWVGYGTLAEAALTRAPAIAAAMPAAGQEGGAVLVADYDAAINLMGAALIAAGEDDATWASAKAAASLTPTCLIPVWTASGGKGPEEATVRCGLYVIEPLARIAKRNGAPWIGADGIYGRTLSIRVASTARIAATKGTTTTTRTETTTGTNSRQSTTAKPGASKIPE